MESLGNLSILMKCYAYSLFRGSAKIRGHITTPPKKIIVMPASHLGDMICATPIFRAIKETYPECKIVVAGLENCAAVHDHNPDVDEYLVMDPNNLSVNVKKSKEVKADVAVVTSPGFEAVAAYFLSGIPVIIGPKVVNGFCPYQTKSYRLMAPLFTCIEHRMRYYAPLEYLKMLEPIRISSEDTTKHVAFSNEARSSVLSYLSNNQIKPGADFIIGMSLSAGNKIKEWPAERFIEVANALSAKYNTVVIFIGSQNDMTKTSETLKSLKSTTRYLDTTGKFSIDELKALVSFMDLFISVDTGPIYIAEALDVPTIDITGPIDENEQPPIGRLHKVVRITNRKNPELYVMNARVYDEKEARRQTEEITADSVINVAEELINVIKSNK